LLHPVLLSQIGPTVLFLPAILRAFRPYVVRGTDQHSS